MKKIVLAFIAIVSILSFVHAQSDTLYIMKAGVVVDKFDVNTQIDSVIFYDPTITVTDYDGNVYNTVTIGTQVWMAENLQTKRYADGTAIPMVYIKDSWDYLKVTDKACCILDGYINYKTDYGYGLLYTWAAAMNGATSVTANPSGIQGVCPTGWHLSSDAEWTQLENYLADNGYNYDGTTGGGGAKIAKALASNTGWYISTETEGAVNNSDYPKYRNKSGFTALSSGYRAKDGVFNFGYCGWWSATENTGTSAWNRNLGTKRTDVARNSYEKQAGMSVRCVKD